jgi:hypothetical protein
MIVIRENSLVATKNYSTSFIAIKISKIPSLPSNNFDVSLVATSVKIYSLRPQKSAIIECVMF